MNHLLELQQSDKSLYQKFWSTNEFIKKNVKFIYPTFSSRYNKFSRNSFSFAETQKKKYDVEENKEILQHLFNISSEDLSLFNNKFQQAISGDGQEARKINVLHSSSLAALLSFYRVSETDPIYLTINGTKYKFIKSYFEVKNSVGFGQDGKEHFSNMDVVLVGANDKNEKTILFLESKFSEYLSAQNNKKISKASYGSIYNQLSSIPGVTIEDSDEDGYLSIHPSTRGGRYCEGVKQMISHFAGLTKSFLKGKPAYQAALKQSFNEKDYEHVILAEIIFDFQSDFSKKKVDDYKQLYQGLYNALQKQLPEKLIYSDQLLTYQNVFAENKILLPNVKAFYNL